MRPSEYAKTRFSQPLTLQQIEFHPSFTYPTSLIVNLYRSKTNQHNNKEMIIMGCTCKKQILGTWCPCVVHHIKHYINFRNTIYGDNPNGYFFMKSNGKPLSYDNMNVFLKNCIKHMNNNYNVNFDPKEYTPHSLRVGGCTDFARRGKPGYIIEQAGRWSSKTWKTTYINLDWRDISTLSGVPICELRECNLSPFVEE